MYSSGSFVRVAIEYSTKIFRYLDATSYKFLYYIKFATEFICEYYPSYVCLGKLYLYVMFDPPILGQFSTKILRYFDVTTYRYRYHNTFSNTS